jgi:hypothetical protein
MLLKIDEWFAARLFNSRKIDIIIQEEVCLLISGNRGIDALRRSGCEYRINCKRNLGVYLEIMYDIIYEKSTE